MENALTRLESIFKEEQWGRIEPKDIGISKFKILDDLFNATVAEGKIEEVRTNCRNQLESNSESITAIYLLGLIGYHIDSIEDSVQLRKLIDIFTSSQKWAVVEIIAEKILEYTENSIALRALAVSLERLGRGKEAVPVLEDLLKIDRFDTEVAKKLAYKLIEEEREKSIYYLKLSIEGFIKARDLDEVVTLWNKLVSITSIDEMDVNFFERVERMLVDLKHNELAATLLKTLFNKFRDEEHPDYSIELLKKILKYRPDDNQARRDLIKFYEAKYGNHSQFEQFLKLAKLGNFKTPVKFAIQDFEKNIVFDKDNYAFHNSWKLGKIVDIDSESIIINFRDKENHRMSIQMALQSLTPVSKDHIYVMQYEDPEMVKSIFKEDFLQFFEILIKSYGNKILLADIKRELIPEYVEEKSWGKWWTRARTQIKKSPLFGVSEKKKDLFFMRDNPVTYVDELLDKFTRTKSFGERLDISIEFSNNIDEKEGASVVQFFVDYFLDEMKGNSETRKILSYFILKDMTRFIDPAKLKLDTQYDKIQEFLKTSTEIPIISKKISSYDYKKDLVNLVRESRDDWPYIVSELLFETPVRIHKYIINSLIRAHEYNVINNFIDRVITGMKQYPEIFFWVAKNLINHTWDYEWLDYSRKQLVLTFFRLLNELKKIETDSNRLKNAALELLFDNEIQILKELVNEFDQAFLGRIYDVFSNISYAEEGDVEKFLGLIKEKYPDFKTENVGDEEEWSFGEEELIVTQAGYDKKKAELDAMVNSEMVTISKELSKVSEATGDMRENVEYTALLEKQGILEMAISKLDREMKKAKILDPDTVNTDVASVGTVVVFSDKKTGSSRSYTILGPWDADFEKNILSYRSPIARSILGKKVGEEFTMKIDDRLMAFVVDKISKFS